MSLITKKTKEHILELNIFCPVCKQNKDIRLGGSVNSIYSAKPYKLASCQNCGHIFISNPPNTTELDAVYKETYNYESHLAIEEEKKWRINKTISNLRNIMPMNTTIIDIGCMYGFALDMFRDLGYSDLIGIEIDKSAVNKCRVKGYDVFEGTFSQWLRSDVCRTNMEKICIYMSHVIEHVQDLDGFFDEVNKVLKTGDYFIVLVPNAKAHTAKLLKKYWGWWQVPVHLHHFSSESIVNLLSVNKFKVELIFKRGADSLFWLSSLASLLGIKSKSNSLSPLQRIIIKIFSFIGKYWYHWGDEELVVVSKKE
jgi:SAM-dependent methyltransferase